jgi:hypothetical protein
MDAEKFTKAMIKGIYQASIILPYEYIKIYVNSMSDKIEKELKDYEVKLAEQRKKEGFLSTFMQSAIHEINKTSMPKYFHNATFIFIYSRFESDFKSICTVYQQEKKFKLSASDLGGQNYISKAKQYLEKCFELDMNSLNTEWEVITKYQKVRNAIAHNNASIITKKDCSIDKQDLYPIISGNSSISLDNSNGEFYIKDKKYLLDFCDVAKTYISKTLELMDK